MTIALINQCQNTNLPLLINFAPESLGRNKIKCLAKLLVCLHSSLNLYPFTVRESLFSNKHLWPLLLFFRLKWAGYLAVAGPNLLAQISDRISPLGV